MEDDEEEVKVSVCRIGKRTDQIAVEERIRVFNTGEVHSSPGSIPPKTSQIPSLTSKCVDAIADNFNKLQTLENIPVNHLIQFYSRVSETIPVRLAALHIADENYWKRRAELEGLTKDSKVISYTQFI